MDVWAERIARARGAHPELTTGLFDQAVASDDTVLGRAIRELISTGRGRRMPEPPEGMRRWNELIGDYSTQRFPAALVELAGSDAHSIVGRTGLSRERLRGLLAGAPPTIEELVVVARAYGRDPAWFHEYRVLAVAVVVAKSLDQQPERSAAIHYSLAAVADG